MLFSYADWYAECISGAGYSAVPAAYICRLVCGVYKWGGLQCGTVRYRTGHSLLRRSPPTNLILQQERGFGGSGVSVQQGGHRGKRRPVGCVAGVEVCDMMIVGATTSRGPAHGGSGVIRGSGGKTPFWSTGNHYLIGDSFSLHTFSRQGRGGHSSSNLVVLHGVGAAAAPGPGAQ